MKTFQIVKNNGFSFISGMLGACSILLISHLVQAPVKPIATVNLTQLVNQFIQNERQKNVSDTRLQMETKKFGQKLEITLKQLTQDKKIILLPSEAVIAGAADYTAEVNHLLHERGTGD